MAETVQIGKAAQVAGVSVDTIRFYQKLGIINSVRRSAGGYRLFDGEQIRDLTFVRHAQELGFSLAEVKTSIAIHHGTFQLADDGIDTPQKQLMVCRRDYSFLILRNGQSAEIR